MPSIFVVHIVHIMHIVRIVRIVRIVHIRVMILVIFRVVYVHAFRRSPRKQATLLPLVQRQRGKRDQHLRVLAVNTGTKCHIFRWRTHLANQRRQFNAVGILLGTQVGLPGDRARALEMLSG